MNLPLYAVAMVATFLLLGAGLRLVLSIGDDSRELAELEAAARPHDVTTYRPWLLTFDEMHAR